MQPVPLVGADEAPKLSAALAPGCSSPPNGLTGASRW